MKPLLLAAALSLAGGCVATGARAADIVCAPNDLACRLKKTERKGGSGGPLNPQDVKRLDAVPEKPSSDSKGSTLRTVP
jgi:hypothetical protein